MMRVLVSGMVGVSDAEAIRQARGRFRIQSFAIGSNMGKSSRAVILENAGTAFRANASQRGLSYLHSGGGVASGEQSSANQ
jgi:hypothetical protein